MTLTASPTLPSSDPADLVLTNGNLITMDPDAPSAAALAVTGEKITAVGGIDEVAAFIGEETAVIDLGGATALPGLVDAHSHFFQHGAGEGMGAGVQDVEILSNGITTTAEFAVDQELYELMRGYEEAGELRVRTSAYLLYNNGCGEVLDDWWRDIEPTREPGELLRVGGIKVFTDGGSCNVPAVSYTYSDGSTGDLYFDIDGVEAIIRDIEGEGHQAAVHAIGDVAIATVLDAMERVIGDGGNPLRHRVEHNAVARPELYGLHQEAGVVAVVFGAFRTCFFTDDTNQFLYRTPDELLSWEWPWRQLLDANPETVFAWQVDFPVFPAELGDHLAGFVTRVDDGCLPPPGIAAGAITIEEALTLMTLGSAYALDRDEEVGSLEVGKFADLVVLNQDPTTVDPAQLEATQAVMTMIGGQVEFCREGFEAICESGTTAPDPDPPEACNPSGENLATGAMVTASQSSPGQPPELAVDGDPETSWSAGHDPEQWIEVDLGDEVELACVRLLVEQFPSGPTVHRVDAGTEPGPGTEIGTIGSDTEALQWLSLAGSGTVRHLRITTLQSPSWVAWREIEVYGAGGG